MLEGQELHKKLKESMDQLENVSNLNSICYACSCTRTIYLCSVKAVVLFDKILLQ